jgi:hypothetical protein
MRCGSYSLLLVGKLPEPELGNPHTGVGDSKRRLKPWPQGQYMIRIQRHRDTTTMCLKVLESDETQIVSALFHPARCLEHSPFGATYGCE